MIEMIDNVFQIIVVICCAVAAGVMAVSKKNKDYCILALFYGVFALGSFYWCIYISLSVVSPLYFPIADMSWIAAYVFLVIFQLRIATPEEKTFRHPASWIAPVAGLGLTCYYFYWSHYITEFLWYAVFSVSGWLSIRGLIWARRQTGKARKRQYFHMNVLFVILIEHALWITSCCIWVTESILNPYYWFDIALSIAVAVLIFTIKKAVEE